MDAKETNTQSPVINKQMPISLAPPQLQKSKVHFEDLNRADLDQANSQDYASKFKKGLSEDLVRKISGDKNEPQWVLDIRLAALKIFHEKPIPQWGPDINNLDFDNIR